MRNDPWLCLSYEGHPSEVTPGQIKPLYPHIQLYSMRQNLPHSHTFTQRPACTRRDPHVCTVQTNALPLTSDSHMFRIFQSKSISIYLALFISGILFNFYWEQFIAQHNTFTFNLIWQFHERGGVAAAECIHCVKYSWTEIEKMRLLAASPVGKENLSRRSWLIMPRVDEDMKLIEVHRFFGQEPKIGF